MTFLALTTDLLLKSVGRRAKNTENIFLGEIIEIIRDSTGDFIEYAILQNKSETDQETRFFAIPVSSSLIQITEAGEIILLMSNEELYNANRITLSQCPSPDFSKKPSCFELFEYKKMDTGNSKLEENQTP